MRIVLKIHHTIVPYKIAVLPLSKKLSPEANDLYNKLSNFCSCGYDDTGGIGKRYRRQDETGTPFCVTVNFETLENNTVTIRCRDNMEQIQININDILNVVTPNINF